MFLLNSISDLARVVAAGRLAPKDQVYVPTGISSVAGAHDWSLVEEALRRAGASVHTLPDLAHIYVLSSEELKAGLYPPFLRSSIQPGQAS